MSAIKINKKELIKAAQEKKAPAKKNYTFRLRTELYNAFERECSNKDVTPTLILEEFMKEFSKK